VFYISPQFLNVEIFAQTNVNEFSIETLAVTRSVDFHVEYNFMLSDFKQNSNVLANFSTPHPSPNTLCYKNAFSISRNDERKANT